MDITAVQAVSKRMLGSGLLLWEEVSQLQLTLKQSMHFTGASTGFLRDAQRFAANNLWCRVSEQGALAIHPRPHVVLSEEICQRLQKAIAGYAVAA